jgi:hypothetical protein
MPNFTYDKLHDFGNAALASDAAFPNVLDLKDTSVERMTVEVRLTAAATGGTSVTIAVQGAPTPGGTFAAIVTGKVIPLAEINALGVYQLPIPPTTHKALKVTITKVGTFTGGGLNAQLNTYIGK